MQFFFRVDSVALLCRVVVLLLLLFFVVAATVVLAALAFFCHAFSLLCLLLLSLFLFGIKLLFFSPLVWHVFT